MKIYKVILIFFVSSLMMPTYSMFMRMRQKLQPGVRSVSGNVSPAKPKPISQKGISPVRLKTASPGKKNTMAALREQVARFLKAQYARLSYLWKTESIPAEQKELAVPIVPSSPPQQPDVTTHMPVEAVEVAIQKVPTSSAAQAESDAIIAKLNGENPWNYPRKSMSDFQIAVNSPLAEEMRNFLEKNNVEDIENLLSLMIEERNNIIDPKYMLSAILKDLCKRNKAFIVKIFPWIEKNYQRIDDMDLLATILLGLPPEFLTQAEKIIEFFFNNVSYFYLITACKPDDMVRLLPEDSKKLVGLIKIICDNITDTVHNDEFGRKEPFDQAISFVAKMFAKRISYMQPDDLQMLVKELLKTETGSKLLLKLDSTTLLTDYIKAEIDQSLQTEGIDLLRWIALYDDIQVKKILIDHIKTSSMAMKTLLKTKNGQGLILKLISFDSSLKVALKNYLNTEKDFRSKDFSSMERSDYLAYLLDGPDFVKIAFDLDSSSYEEMPSYRHLVKFYQLLPELPTNIWDFTFKNMVKMCLNTEKESFGKYEVFYHGRRWKYRLLSNFYDMFYSHKTGKNLDDFSFTHFIDPVTKVNMEFFAKEAEIRKLLMEKGNEFSWHTRSTEITRESILGSVNRQRLLFLNKFLFGNLGNFGSCSIFYILLNKNQDYGNISFSIAEIFDMFGYRDIYHMYEKELQDLEEKHDNLSSYGELLQILVPKEKVDKCIYYTTSGGPKKAFEGKTTDIKEILSELDEDPKDQVEFVLVETSDPDGGLSRDSGLKVFSRTLVKPEEMKEFEEKDEKLLLNKILESIKQKDREKEIAAMTRE